MALYTVPTDLISLPSALGGELLTFDATGSSVIVAPGSDGDILSVVAGLPAFIDPNDPGVNLSIAAANVTYDNAISGLTATDVQAALDEIVATGVGFDISSLTTGTIETGDYIAFQDVNGGDVTLRTTVDQLATLLTSLGVGGGAVNFAEQVYVSGLDFNAPGPDTTLTLPAIAAAEQAVFVFFDGIFQNNTVWSLGPGGTDIIFAQPIPSFVTEIEIRVAEDTAGAPVYMEEVRETAPFVGTPYDIALPADPTSLDNVWVFFNGIYQANDGVELQLIAGPTLRIVNGVPAEVTEVLVKIGSTVATALDISTLTDGSLETLEDADLFAFHDDTDSTTKFGTLLQLANYVGGVGGGGAGLVGIQSFTSNGTYNPTVGTNAILVFCTGGGGGGSNGTVGGGNGGNGGSSSFGAFCSATGGEGGFREATGNNPGTPGVGSGGIINLSGGYGIRELQSESTAGLMGGGSFWVPGLGQGINVPSRVATSYGCGRAGAEDPGVGTGQGGSGHGGGTSIDFITSGFSSVTVTIGAGGSAGGNDGSGNPLVGASGIVVVFEFA